MEATKRCTFLCLLVTSSLCILTSGTSITPTVANTTPPNNATPPIRAIPLTEATPLSKTTPMLTTAAADSPTAESDGENVTRIDDVDQTTQRPTRGAMSSTLLMHTTSLVALSGVPPTMSADALFVPTHFDTSTRTPTTMSEDATDLVDYSGESDNAVGNPTQKTATSFIWDPIAWSWVLILQLISAVIGIVGNFLVIVVLFQRRKKSRSTDTLIGGLACADFLTSVFIVPHPWATSVPSTWLGEVYCRVIYTRILLWTSITASAYLLMFISVERYIAVINPLHFNRLFNRRRVSLFIVLIWLLSVLSGVYVYIVFAVDSSTGSCMEAYMSVTARVAIAYYWFALRLVIPCLTMLITQVLIARELHHQSARFRGFSGTGHNGGRDGISISGNATGARPGKAKGNHPSSYHIVARNRVIKMMLIVVLIYIVCWSPNQIAYLGYQLGWVDPSYIGSTVHDLLTVLGFYNSCANPVIYTARYPEFREALKDIFTCTPTRNAPLFEKGFPSDRYVTDRNTNTNSEVQNDQV